MCLTAMTKRIKRNLQKEKGDHLLILARSFRYLRVDLLQNGGFFYAHQTTNKGWLSFLVNTLSNTSTSWWKTEVKFSWLVVLKTNRQWWSFPKTMSVIVKRFLAPRRKPILELSSSICLSIYKWLKGTVMGGSWLNLLILMIYCFLSTSIPKWRALVSNG